MRSCTRACKCVRMVVGAVQLNTKVLFLSKQQALMKSSRAAKHHIRLRSQIAWRDGVAKDWPLVILPGICSVIREQKQRRVRLQLASCGIWSQASGPQLSKVVRNAAARAYQVVRNAAARAYQVLS